MEGLQDDVLLLILSEYLHVTDLVACRLLSKRIKFLVDNFVKIKKFFFSFGSRDRYLSFGALRLSDLTDNQTEREPPTPNHILFFPSNASAWYLPRNSSFQLLCSNLKSLKIDPLFTVDHLNMSTLNQFSRLEELFICNTFIVPSSPTVLDLPNLKVFVIRWSPIYTDRESPKLVVNSKIKNFVFIQQWDNKFELPFQLKSPELLEFLSVSHLKYEKLSSFKNLRVLHFRSISESNLNVVDVLPGLEAISLQYYDYKYNQAERAANHLMHRRRVLRRENLKIYFFGILLNRPFADYKFKETGRTELATLHLEHYDQLAERFPCIEEIDYTKFVNHLEGLTANKRLPLDSQGLPVNFFRRMNIRSILITEIRNSDQFTSFLKQCKYVEELTFDHETRFQIDQSIVNLIADLYALSLTRLLLLNWKRRSEDTEISPWTIDFKPFTKMQQLNFFKVLLWKPKFKKNLSFELKKEARSKEYKFSWKVGYEMWEHPRGYGTADLSMAIDELHSLLNETNPRLTGQVY